MTWEHVAQGLHDAGNVLYSAPNNYLEVSIMEEKVSIERDHQGYYILRVKTVHGDTSFTVTPHILLNIGDWLNENRIQLLEDNRHIEKNAVIAHLDI